MLYYAFAYGEWGLIDRTGKIVVPIEYTFISSIITISDLECYRVQKNFEKFGLIRNDGFILIEAVYDLIAYNERQELFVVVKDGKFGVINLKGVKIIPIQCTKIQFTSEKGKVIIGIREKWYLIDLYGKTEKALDFSGYNCVLTISIDSTDRTVDTCDILYIVEDNKKGIINIAGDLLIPCLYDNLEYISNSWIIANLNGKIGVINIWGKTVIPIEYNFINDFNNGLAYAESDIYTGYIDKQGRQVVKLQYEESDYEDFIIFPPFYSNGLIPFCENKKHGLMDKDLNVVVEPIYDSIHNYEFLDERGSNQIIVGIDGGYRLLNDEGVKITSLLYDYIGYKSSAGGLRLVRKDQKYGFIDLEGNLIIELIYERAFDFEQNSAPVLIDNKWGLIDEDNQFVIEPMYDFILPFQNGLAWVELNGKWGYINIEGEEIIKVKNDFGYFYYKNRGSININSDGAMTYPETFYGEKVLIGFGKGRCIDDF